MRFVFFSYHYSPDIQSPEEWLDRINFYVGSLDYLSRTNSVIRIDQINYEGNFIHNGVQYFCIKPSKKKNYFPIKLNRFVKSLKPDVVIVGSFNAPFQIVQLRLCLGKKVKIIIQNHAEKPFVRIKKQLQKMADKFINAYFFASRMTAVEWVDKGNISSLKKVHEIMEVSSAFNPIDKIIARSKTKVSAGPVYLWAGRLNENKDPLTVVNAFLKFAAIHPGVTLYMIYQTSELLNEVKKRIAANKSSKDSIVLVGKVPHPEMLYWFNSADFLISGSHYEGSGTVVCEAMSCGCVPVVTDIPSFRTITADGNCGLLYEAGNENELLSTLVQTMQMDILEKREKALEYFKNQLSFKSIAEAVSRVCNELVFK